MMRIGLLIVVVATVMYAATVNVLFLEVAPGGAPSIEREFFRRLGQSLSSIDTIRLVDYQLTQELCKAVPSSLQRSLSNRAIEKIRQYFGDSVLVLRTHVDECTFRPIRKWGVVCEAMGEMRISCEMFSLLESKYIYSGRVRCSSSRYHGLFFFSPLRLEHITAVEKARLIDDLCDRAAKRIVNIMQTVLSSILARREFTEVAENTGVELVRIPVDSLAPTDTVLHESSVEAADTLRASEERARQ